MVWPCCSKSDQSEGRLCFQMMMLRDDDGESADGGSVVWKDRNIFIIRLKCRRTLISPRLYPNEDMGCRSAKVQLERDLTGRGLEATGADATMVIAKEAIGKMDRLLSGIIDDVPGEKALCAR